MTVGNENNNNNKNKNKKTKKKKVVSRSLGLRILNKRVLGCGELTIKVLLGAM